MSEEEWKGVLNSHNTVQDLNRFIQQNGLMDDDHVTERRNVIMQVSIGIIIYDIGY